MMTCPSRGPRFWTDSSSLTRWFCGDYANFEGRDDVLDPPDPQERPLLDSENDLDFYSGLISRAGIFDEPRWPYMPGRNNLPVRLDCNRISILVYTFVVKKVGRYNAANAKRGVEFHRCEQPAGFQCL